MDLFDIAIARKLSSGGGGGGGSSEYSTAEVTLNLTPPEGVTVVTECVTSVLPTNNGNYYDNAGNALYTQDHVVTIVMHNGVGYVTWMAAYDSDWQGCGADPADVAISGDATYIAEGIAEYNMPLIAVTGNCTLTATLDTWGY